MEAQSNTPPCHRTQMEVAQRRAESPLHRMVRAPCMLGGGREGVHKVVKPSDRCARTILKVGVPERAVVFPATAQLALYRETN